MLIVIAWPTAAPGSSDSTCTWIGIVPERLSSACAIASRSPGVIDIFYLLDVIKFSRTHVPGPREWRGER